MNTLLALIFTTAIYTAPAMDPIDQGTTRCYTDPFGNFICYD